MSDEMQEIEDEVVALKETKKTGEEITAIFQKWWADNINDSPVSRNTEILNYLTSKKDILLKAFG